MRDEWSWVHQAGLQQILSANVKRYRKKLGMTQSELAEKAGFSLRSLQQLEAGQGNPTLDTIGNISKVLRVTVDYLLSLSCLHIDTDLDGFKNCFHTYFADHDLSVGIRDRSGNVLWTNRNAQNMLVIPDEFKTAGASMYEALVPNAEHLLNFQFEIEKLNFAMPYLTMFKSSDVPSGVKILRSYPTLICGQNDLYLCTCVYAAPIETDTSECYFEYCMNLLQIAAQFE